MSLFQAFDVAGSAMSAQSKRLNMTASNLANANSVAGSPEEAYKARHPVFQAVMKGEGAAGVNMTGVYESEAPAKARYSPGHPLADDKGYVYAPNVNLVEEMVDMISASRSYQTNVEIMNTSKEMMMRTLQLGK